MYKCVFSPIQELNSTSVSPPPIKPNFALKNTLPSSLQKKLKRKCGDMDEGDVGLLPKQKK